MERADALAPDDTAAADAIPMILTDFAAESLTGALTLQDSRETIAELDAAVAALPAMAFQFQPDAR